MGSKLKEWTIRELIHAGAGFFLGFTTCFLLIYLTARSPAATLALATAGLVVSAFAIFEMRETKLGEPLEKSFLDVAVWGASATAGAILLLRLLGLQ